MLKAQLPVGGFLGNDLMESSLTESMGIYIDDIIGMWQKSLEIGSTWRKKVPESVFLGVVSCSWPLCSLYYLEEVVKCS